MEYQEPYNTNTESSDLTSSERSFLNRWCGDLDRIASLAHLVLSNEARAKLISALNETIDKISTGNASEVRPIE